MLKIINLRVGINSQQSLKNIVARKLKIPVGHINKIQLIKKSIDARQKNNIALVYALAIEVENEAEVYHNIQDDKNITPLILPTQHDPIYGNDKLHHPPVVVGSGPAGIIAAYLLAQHGYKPILLERGKDVAARSADVNHFWLTGSLNPESNVQFGAGGAGTFSDGKLTTRINDPIIRRILDIFVECGAPAEILYQYKPHIGTDYLKTMISTILNKITALGGKVCFNSKVTDITLQDGQLVGVQINNAEHLACNQLILAIGHSARDTYKMLATRSVAMQAKPLAIGVRIEHTQDFINKMQYGQINADLLGAADYNVVYKDEITQRAAYSFCMCPGGMIIAATNIEGATVTNGMSMYKRNSPLANAAMVVQVDEKDFGQGVLAGMNFQEKYERLAYSLAGKNYFAPAQDVPSFINQTTPTLNCSFISSYRPGVIAADLRKALPPEVAEVLSRALVYFDKRLPGFSHDALLVGIETRTSAPLRILRDDTRQSLNIQGLYPTGEGAGYAGGIISAAVDGYHVAQEIIKKFAPLA